jgi:hypothetical protein
MSIAFDQNFSLSDVACSHICAATKSYRSRANPFGIVPKRLLNAGAFMMTGGRVLPSVRHKRAYRAHEPDIERAAEGLSRAASAAIAGAADAGVERAIERGEDTTVATFVLEQLRKVVRGTDEEARPRTDDPAPLLFRPLEPFLVDTNFPVRPGQVRRASLLPVWQWLMRAGRARPGARIRSGAGRDAENRNDIRSRTGDP